MEFEEIVDEMNDEEIRQACEEEGADMSGFAQDGVGRRAALLRHFMLANGIEVPDTPGAEAGDAGARAPAEQQMDFDECSEMLDDMSEEEVTQACEEEGLGLPAGSSLQDMRQALLRSYCGTAGPAGGASPPVAATQAIPDDAVSYAEYKEMVDEMDDDEVAEACCEEGIETAGAAPPELRVLLLTTLAGGAVAAPAGAAEEAGDGEDGARGSTCERPSLEQAVRRTMP